MTRGTQPTLTRAAWLSLTLSLLSVGCGDDAKPDQPIADKPVQDAGDPQPVDSGATDEDGGAAIVCDGDVANTPGHECAGVVACGGSLAEPLACPRATHSCCVSGLPSNDTVNCHEGTQACQEGESQTPCDGPEDCGAGQVCCVSPPSAHVTTECRAITDCDSPEKGTMFCHTDDDCPGGKSCTPPSFASWWGFCG